MADGNLPLDVDPKRAWADGHLRHAPVDVMRASREELLRIQGSGRAPPIRSFRPGSATV